MKDFHAPEFTGGRITVVKKEFLKCCYSNAHAQNTNRASVFHLKQVCERDNLSFSNVNK